MKKQGIGRLLEIAGEKKGLLVLSGGLAALSAACALAPYLSVYHILAELLAKVEDPSRIDGPLMTHWAFVALVGLVASLLFLYVGSMAAHVAAFRILYGLRVRLAEHVGRLPLGYLTRTSTGAVKKTLEQNVEKIENFVAHKIPDLVGVTATIAIMTAAMVSLSPAITVTCLAVVALGFFVLLHPMAGDRGKALVKGYYDALERINASAIQYVRGMAAVKLFGRTVRSFRRFHQDMVDYSRLATRFTDIFQNGFVLFRTLLASLLAFVLPVGVLLLSRRPQDLSLGLTLLFFLVMVPGLATPLYKVMYLSSTLRDIAEGVERIDALFAQPALAEPAERTVPTTYDVVFDDVSFSYGSYGASEESSRVEALSHLSFRARQGALTALVGPSGSGKSTAANLIPRFWDVDGGAISIGGVDIRKMRTEDLMETVSFVFQDTFLFFDTLYNNILVGRPDATAEEVYAAARAAQCHSFIERLPQGYDTLIGEGGVYLSGGEEQRVAVARAILKGAPVLVLDEATAFADPENEEKMEQALKELIRDKTVLVIAHRLSTIRHADAIVVLDGGKKVEEGRHDALVDRGGLYASLWEAHCSAGSWSLAKGERR